MEEGDDYSIPKGEEGITELLWRNGHVVMQNQRPPKKAEIPEVRLSLEEQQLFAQEDEMAYRIQYSLDDLYADLLYPDPPPPPPIPAVTQPRVVSEIRPPPVTKPDDAPRRQNFVHFSRLPAKLRTEKAVEPPPEARVSYGERSNVCRGASIPAGESTAGACDITVTTVTSSSPGGSFSSEGRQPQWDRRRRAREIEDDGYQSEDIDFEVVEVKKPTLRPKTSKRTRAAEVHNQSERRRRDRINEKMKALQELIPRCTKSDKASMLDEAINYLKSLQMQVQMMSSMGCPTMFPGMQQYMPAAAMGLGARPMMPYPPMGNSRFPVMPNRNAQVPVGNEASFYQYQNQAAVSKHARGSQHNI